jgi:methionine aminopeptidase
MAKKEMDVQQLTDINDCRKAAEVHRQTRRYIQEIIKPGTDLTYLCNEIERSNKVLLNANGLQSG